VGFLDFFFGADAIICSVEIQSTLLVLPILEHFAQAFELLVVDGVHLALDGTELHFFLFDPLLGFLVIRGQKIRAYPFVGEPLFFFSATSLSFRSTGSSLASRSCCLASGGGMDCFFNERFLLVFRNSDV
jgi:hypothetical protein